MQSREILKASMPRHVLLASIRQRLSNGDMHTDLPVHWAQLEYSIL